MRFFGPIFLMMMTLVLPALPRAATMMATQLAAHLLAHSPEQGVWRSRRYQKELDVTHAYIPLNPDLRIGLSHSDAQSQPAWATDIEWVQPLMLSHRPWALSQEAKAQLALTTHLIQREQTDRYAQILQAIVSYDIQRQAWTRLSQRIAPFQSLLVYANARPQRSPQEQVDTAILRAFVHDMTVALQQRHVAMTDAKLAIQEWGPFAWQGPIQRPPLPPTLPPLTITDTPEWAVLTHHRRHLEASRQKWDTFRDPAVAVTVRGTLPLTPYNGGSTVGVGVTVAPPIHHPSKGAWATTHAAIEGLGPQEETAKQVLQAQSLAIQHGYHAAMAQLTPADDAHLKALHQALLRATRDLQRGLVSAVSVVELGRLLLAHEDRYHQALAAAHRAHIEWGRFSGQGVR